MGKAKTIKIDVTKVIQVKIGNLKKVIPGALMFTIVTTKLSPAAIEATPKMLSPTIQKVIPEPGLNVAEELGAYPNQPPSGACPINQLKFISKDPKRKIQ